MEYILGWNHTPGVFSWRVESSKQKNSAVFDTPCLNNGIIFDPSPALHLTWQSSSPWDCGTTYPKIIFFACLWSFILRTVTLWIKVGVLDVKDNFHLTAWNPWSSVTVPEAELTTVLTSAPEGQTWTHNIQPHGWIPALNSPQLFTCTGYVTLQDLSQNAKLISYLGFTTVSSSCRHNVISEARLKLLKKSTVTAAMTEYIKTANNILFAHCFKTANTKLLPCSLRSNEVEHLVQVIRIPRHCSQEKLFSCSVWPNAWKTCVLIKYMCWNG